MPKKKKAYLVMSRNTNVLEKGLKTDKGHLKFKNGKTSMMVGDDALADEIDKTHGLKGSGDVWVHEDPQAEPFLRDDGAQGMGVHKYFWGSSNKFSDAWEEFEKRRKDKKKKTITRRTKKTSLVRTAKADGDKQYDNSV